MKELSKRWLIRDLSTGQYIEGSFFNEQQAKDTRSELLLRNCFIEPCYLNRPISIVNTEIHTLQEILR
jgi:hypothetical protein